MPNFSRPFLVYMPASFVSVAELSIHRVHCIANRNVRHADAPQRHGVLERAVARRGRVEDGDGPRDLARPSPRILVLPDPPRSVDLAVVEEELCKGPSSGLWSR